METLRVQRWRPLSLIVCTSSPASTTDQNMCNCKYFLLILKKTKNKKTKSTKILVSSSSPPLCTLWFLFNINTLCVLLAPGATYLIDNNNTEETRNKLSAQKSPHSKSKTRKTAFRFVWVLLAMHFHNRPTRSFFSPIAPIS